MFPKVNRIQVYRVKCVGSILEGVVSTISYTTEASGDEKCRGRQLPWVRSPWVLSLCQSARRREARIN